MTLRGNDASPGAAAVVAGDGTLADAQPLEAVAASSFRTTTEVTSA